MQVHKLVYLPNSTDETYKHRYDCADFTDYSTDIHLRSKGPFLSVGTVPCACPRVPYDARTGARHCPYGIPLLNAGWYEIILGEPFPIHHLGSDEMPSRYTRIVGIIALWTRPDIESQVMGYAVLVQR